MLSIGQLLLIVIPLILIAAVGCGLCWHFSGKRSYKKGYDTRKEEAEAVFGSAEAEGKRLVSEAVKDGESKKRECLPYYSGINLVRSVFTEGEKVYG